MGVAHIPAITASAMEGVASIPTLKSLGTSPDERKTFPRKEEAEGSKRQKIEEPVAFNISVFPDLPLVFPSLSFHSAIVYQLKQLSVANIAVDIASTNQLAGRLSLFKTNWDKICNDRWVLDAIQGYQREWLTRPCQRHQPICPHSSKEETESLQTEVDKMVSKGAITPVETGMENGFVSSIFLIPKKD